jgi:hypothetical protein
LPEPTASLQRRLLESEGIEVHGLSMDFKKYGWAPGKPKKQTKPKKRKNAKRRPARN